MSSTRPLPVPGVPLETFSHGVAVPAVHVHPGWVVTSTCNTAPENRTPFKIVGATVYVHGVGAGGGVGVGAGGVGVGAGVGVGVGVGVGAGGSVVGADGTSVGGGAGGVTTGGTSAGGTGAPGTGGGAAAWRIAIVAPDTSTVAVRSEPPFVAIRNTTSALPLPFEADAIVTHDARGMTVHEQKSSVDSRTVRSPPVDPIATSDGDTFQGHVAAAWDIDAR